MIYVRPINTTDGVQIHKWRHTKDIWTFTSTKYTEFSSRSLEDEIEWIYSIQNNPTRYDFIICTVLNTPIGFVSLTNVDFNAKLAELNIYIGEVEHHGKGYASQAVKLIQIYAFQILKLTSIYLYVHTDNLAAIRLYEKNEFSKTTDTDDYPFLKFTFSDLLNVHPLH